MQVWKKAFSLLLAFALLLSCCPAITLTASAADVKGEPIATITFGADGSASHSDGSKLGTTKSYTEGTYTLALTGCTNIYGGARDAKGNSCLKFGASSKAGSLTFAVSEDVAYVVVRLAKYKSNASKCTINGTAYTLTKNSNDGDYDEIEVDTTATKSVTIKTVSGGYRMMMDSVSFYKAASTEEPEGTEPVVTEPVETEPVETEAPTEPSVPEETEPAVVPEGRVAIFEFGEKAAAGHKENSTAMTSGNVSYTDNGYSITFTDCSNVYDKCNDEKGNSAIKFGTGSKIGSLTFTVADDVDYIVIKLAKYKANASKYSINGGAAVALTKSSNDGEYEEITVDTTTTKTITVATVSGSYRMMMDSISFFSNGGVAPEPPVTEPTEPPVVEPDDGTLLTIPQAIEMGAAKEHDTYTNNKFKVSGVITEVYNTTYGNMKITDEAGNILTIYGTYSADGKIRYDAMEVKPQVGDTVTLYGIIGQYKDSPQMKNGWIVEHKPMPTATVVLTPSKTEVKRGEEFTVTVSVTQAETYSSLGFDPTFEATGFAVVNTVVAEEAARKATMSGFDAEKGYNGVLMLSAAEAFTGDIFVYTLQAKEDMSLGAAVLTGTATANNNTQPLKITLTNAEVTVVCAHETLVDFESVDNATHKYTCDDCGETFTAAHGYDDEGFCESCGWYKQYTIVYKNWDGTVLAELTGIYYDWLEYQGETPVKPADETYTYAFRGWTPEVDIVTGDAEYTAVFEPVYIDYTVTFKDHDGTVLATGTYHYGDTVTAPAPADWHDEKQVYTFSGWDAEIATVTGNAEYTACYEVNGLRGDFTGDGKISDRDALYLLRVTLEMPGFELNQSGDTNGDGNVTDADVAYLLRHVLFPHRYTLY